MKKLPARYAMVITPLMLSLFMTCLVTLINTVLNGGVSALPVGWLQAWGVSWLVAFPSLLTILPLVRRATSALVDTTQT